MTEVLIEKREEIESILNYLHVAAHLLSRGIVTMKEHREIMSEEEVHRVPKLLDIIKFRDKASGSLIDAMQDPDLKGDYNELVEKLKESYKNYRSAESADSSQIISPETEAIETL